MATAQPTEARSLHPVATAPVDEPRVHPVVNLDYRVRMIAMLVVALIPLFHFGGRPPLPALVGMIFTGLVWPHVAFLAARRARDTRAAEFRNLLVDSFFIGCWTAGLSFSLLPGIVMLSAIHSANLSVGGLRQAARALVATLLGILAVGIPLRFSFHPEST
ncbi:MAG TPA: MASE2 domain-containing protein, partial [Thermoanaerobaculia bacterium]